MNKSCFLCFWFIREMQNKQLCKLGDKDYSLEKFYLFMFKRTNLFKYNILYNNFIKLAFKLNNR